MMAWSGVVHSVNGHEYSAYCIGNVGLTKQTECLFTPMCFRQIIWSSSFCWKLCENEITLYCYSFLSYHYKVRQMKWIFLLHTVPRLLL